jgi:TnpA family transposase
MADTYIVFAQKLIPGTQRDSSHVLDGLLANQAGIQPEMVSTDTADASEIVFALAWALGYRWAPRLADLPDQRLWRIDRDGHYGPLNGLARHRINTRLIAENWDEICRLTASLRAGTVVPSAILRTLQRGPSPSSLARACSAAGNAATPSPEPSSTASAARSGGTTRSGRKTSSTASASAAAS